MENILSVKLDKSAVINTSWKTTPDGGDPKKDFVQVAGEISFEGLTVLDLMNIATKPIVIRRQVVERTLNVIPTTCKVHATSAGQKPFDPKTGVVKMTDAQARETLAELEKRFAK